MGVDTLCVTGNPNQFFCGSATFTLRFWLGGGVRGYPGGCCLYLCIQPCFRMVPIRSNCYRVVSLRWCVMRTLRSSSKLSAATMTRSSVVIPGLVMYFYLWKTVAKILVDLVSFIYITHDWLFSKAVPRTYPLL